MAFDLRDQAWVRRNLGSRRSADYTTYAFSGSTQSDSQYALEIATSNLGTGSYSFWAIYGTGQAVYVLVIVSP